MQVIAYIVNSLISFYVFAIILMVVMSWLITFGVVNPHNQLVSTLLRLGEAITEPALRPIRRILPSLGGIDLSPLILLIGVQALQVGLNSYIFTPLALRGY